MAKKDAALDAWNVSEQELLPFYLNYAILAPSSHNTQPWLFRIVDNSIKLYVDRTRALPVLDPEDRELIISCGAALYNLIVAIRHFGYDYTLEILPNSDDEDLIAQVTMGSHTYAAMDQEKKLCRAIARRRTNRSAFEYRELPASLLSSFESAVSEGGTYSSLGKTESSSVWIHIIKEIQVKNALADLVGEADRIQMSDKKFRREVASWIHPNRSHSRDGIPGYSFGLIDCMSLMAPFVVRTFDIGEGEAAKDRQLASGSPVLLIMGTDNDEPLDWVKTGMALSKILLLATSEGVWSSFLNQPIEVPQLRSKMMEVVNRQGGFPQLLLRMGYSQKEVRPTPRRQLADFLRS